MRVALYLPRTLALWEVRCVEGVREHVVAVVWADRPGHAVLGAWRAADRRLFGGDDVLAPAPTPDWLSAVPVRTLDDLGADVVLDLVGTLERAPVPIWQHRFDGETDAAAAVARQVLSGRSTCESALVQDGKVLVASTSRVDRSLVRHARAHLSKTAGFAARALGPVAEGDAPLVAPPGPLRTAAWAVEYAVRLAGDLARRAVLEPQWFLATARCAPGEPMPRAFDGFEPLFPPPDRFWADPFLAGGFLFFEDYPFATRKGVISCMRPAGAGWSAPEVVLERPYHLSYPCVFQWEGAWFMVPETGANGTVELYRADDFPRGWVLDTVLLDGVRAADATLLDRDGWWMFVGLAAPGASPDDELHLFRADSPRGPWTPHPANPIVSDVRRARPAGRLFEDDGVLYRPAQDGGPGYGSGIALHRVDRLDATGYAETLVARIGPDWRPGLRGTHTLNRDGGRVVVDGLRNVRRWRV